MQSSEAVHVLPPEHFESYLNSFTRMSQTNQLAKSLCQMFVWTYFIPGLILSFLFYSINLSVRTGSPFLFAYFIIATMFNCFIVGKLLSNSNGQRQQTQDVESSTSSASLDRPPTYWDAVKDPPSYSFLQFYRKIISSKTWDRHNNSLEKQQPSDSSSTPGTLQMQNSARGKETRPWFNRNVSCPN